MGISADQVAEGFFQQCPFGLSRFQGKVGKLFADYLEAAHVDLFEYFAGFAFARMSAVDVLRFSKPFALLFRGDGRFGFVPALGSVNPKDIVDVFVVGIVDVRVHIPNQ